MGDEEEDKSAAARAKAFGYGALGALFVGVLLAVALWLAMKAGTSYGGALFVVVVLVLLAIIVGYFATGRLSLLGFVVQLKQEAQILFARNTTEADAKLEDAQRTLVAFVLIVACGVAGIFIYCLQFTPAGFVTVFGGAVIAATAFFAVGVAIGFLFGIPRTLQGDSGVADSSKLGTQDGTPGRSSAPRVATNTNLEQISDWLTKIIVGLGLVNLQKFPPYLKRLLDLTSPYLNYDRNLALAIVVGYSVCGFLLSYLLTRLYLAPALVRAIVETDRASDVEKVLNRVGREAAAKPVGEKEFAANQPVKPTEVDAASTILELAKSGATDDLRKQVEALASDYDNIRITHGPGSSRTRLMEIVASKMRALGLALQSLLPELINADTAGRRLAAVSFLEVQPRTEYVEWLSERVEKEQPFIGYHAARALRLAVQELPDVGLEQLQAAIERAFTAVADKKDADRTLTLTAALAEVKKRRGL